MTRSLLHVVGAGERETEAVAVIEGSDGLPQEAGGGQSERCLREQGLGQGVMIEGVGSDDDLVDGGAAGIVSEYLGGDQALGGHE